MNSINQKLKTDKVDVSNVKLFLTFFKIGATSFGGFLALVSVIQDKLVTKDKWISDDLILEAISLSAIMPGPLAVNVVTYIGYHLKGMKGALISMTGVILPSFILMIGLSKIYLEYNSLPIFEDFFKGILPAVTSIIIATGINMSKKNIADYKQLLISIFSALLIYLIGGIYTTLFVLFGSGIMGLILYKFSVNKNDHQLLKTIYSEFVIIISHNYIKVIVIFLSIIGLLFFPIGEATWKNEIVLLRQLFLTFGGMSLTLFGGGYVIIPIIQEIIVNSLHWITQQQFVDAIAMGQITPGPILISAAFIGYKLGGILGAAIATIAIFLPAGILMILCSRFFSVIKDSAIIMTMFKGIKPAVIGMIFAAAATIGLQSVLTWQTIFILILTLILAIKFKFNVIYLILLSGLLGWILF